VSDVTQTLVNRAVYSFEELHLNRQGYPQFCDSERYKTPYAIFRMVQRSATSRLERAMCSYFFRKVGAECAYLDGYLGQSYADTREPYVVGRLADRKNFPLFFRLGLNNKVPVIQAIYIGKGAVDKRDIWLFEASQRRNGLVYVHRDRTVVAKKTLGVHAARIERLLGIKMTRQLLTECRS